MPGLLKLHYSPNASQLRGQPSFGAAPCGSGAKGYTVALVGNKDAVECKRCLARIEKDERGLDEAVRSAKIAADLDPDQKHAPSLFVDFIEQEWVTPFWHRQIDRSIKAIEDRVASS